MSERLPLAAQYLAQVLPSIPLAVRRHPGSREFRAALLAISERTGLMPTRREIAEACAILGAHIPAADPRSRN